MTIIWAALLLAFLSGCYCAEWCHLADEEDWW
jgi:hypothetical protein